MQQAAVQQQVSIVSLIVISSPLSVMLFTAPSYSLSSLKHILTYVGIATYPYATGIYSYGTTAKPTRGTSSHPSASDGNATP